ncbi:kelch domain-containing protein 4 [Harmonia axyridis]|uniref:kelch domain-containing protein 4 n=1 Tax=Harmonia axyridis TaxID=115357 RepID=UPI001E276062|nr:kelch domain-containing protein 4 [Harmonia axyridis]
MGKKAKDKKKGKGAEKTALKTEKKLSNKMKKALKLTGEDDIENVVAQIEKEEMKRQKVIEKTIDPPTRRLNFTLIAHPDKDQLCMFGGEFFDGQKTILYNDLIFYNIANNSWNIVKVPGAPPSRCGHQMVATSANGGQLWVFGGEFTSLSQSQFYHYQDLWVYYIAEKKWEKITAANGPSARSGHRMVLQKKKLFVFGGFHDNLRSFKYFNDVFTFDLEKYEWKKLEVSGLAPSPRSGCVMLPTQDGRILIYGGYSKENIKKDVDKGIVHSDAFLLQPDKNDSTGEKWKWVHKKLSGNYISPRCSMSATMTSSNSTAYCYGGVFDVEDDEEDLDSKFFNDCCLLDTDKMQWKIMQPTRGKTKPKFEDNIDEHVDMTSEITASQKVSNDGVFTVTVGPAVQSSATKVQDEKVSIFQPCPRINCGLAIKKGILYLYGGMFEQGEKQITLNDFYSIDIKKCNEWKTIIEDKNSELSWVGSDSEEEESSSESENSESEEED